MAITERTLKKWRREALWFKESEPIEGTIDANLTYVTKVQLCDRILRMTQELLDQHLLRKEVR